MHIQAHKDNEKNNETYEQGEPSNGGVQHYPLQRSKYLPCPLKLHIYPSDTKANDKRQTHHCSTVSLSAPDPPHPVALLECVPRPPPSPKYIWFRGLQQSECRFCFLSPMNVKISSISASLTSFGTGAFGKASARSVTHDETVCGETFRWRAIRRRYRRTFRLPVFAGSLDT